MTAATCDTCAYLNGPGALPSPCTHTGATAMTTALTVRPTADEMARATALAVEMGRTPTSNEVVKALKVGRDMARKILDGLDHSTPDCPGLVEQSTPDSYPVQLVIGMDGEIGEAPAEADTDPTQSGDRPVAVHPSPVGQSTTVHAAPTAVDIPDPRTVDRPLSLVRDGGLATVHPAVHPGLMAQSTPGLGDDETGVDTDTDRAQSTYSPVAGLVDYDTVHPQSTPVVDEPATGLGTVDATTTGLDHSTQQSGDRPVTDTAVHPGLVEQSTPDRRPWLPSGDTLVTAGPLLGLNIAAVFGQYSALSTMPGISGPGALGIAAVLESLALFLSHHAHRALMEGDSASRLRVLSYLLGLGIGVLNYSDQAGPHWAPTPLALVYGLASALSPWLWAIHSRFVSRARLRAMGLIERRAAKFAVARWVMYPVRTLRMLRWSVWSGNQDPSAAVTWWNADKARRAAATPKGDTK